VRDEVGEADEPVSDNPQDWSSDRREDCLGDDLSGSWRYALKRLTAPNWSARLRMLSVRLYPEALVDGGQFSVWIQLGEVGKARIG
jgi:hypothetical protein